MDIISIRTHPFNPFNRLLVFFCDHASTPTSSGKSSSILPRCYVTERENEHAGIYCYKEKNNTQPTNFEVVFNSSLNKLIYHLPTRGYKSGNVVSKPTYIPAISLYVFTFREYTALFFPLLLSVI